jgi:hypothetical protein
MLFTDELSTQKAQDAAANAARYAEKTLHHHSAAELVAIGGGWSVQPIYKEWRRIEYNGGIDRYAVCYRPDGGGFLVSDDGEGVARLRAKNNLAGNDPRLTDMPQTLGRDFPDFYFDGRSLSIRHVPGEMLGDAICRALRLIYRFANRSL